LVTIKAVHKIVATSHHNNIDESSFKDALVRAVKEK
jgi:hypothetical protein